MSLLKDAVVEAIRRMPENYKAKDINNKIRLIDNEIKELESRNIENITIDELLRRVNLKIPEC